MKSLAFAILLACLPLGAQTGSKPAENTFDSLRFLEGTWQAQGQGAGGAAAAGSYTFQTELDGHIMARHSTTDPNCKGPASFDCKHGDLLYIFEDGPGQPLKAIYFDNEGHVIHYDVSTPTPDTAIFLSEPGHGPQFRLTYERKASIMSGKFQMQMPGQAEWRSYLEWSGAKK